MVLDVLVLGFVLPFAVLVVAVALARAAQKRLTRWAWVSVAALSVVWMAGSLFSVIACCS